MNSSPLNSFLRVPSQNGSLAYWWSLYNLDAEIDEKDKKKWGEKSYLIKLNYGNVARILHGIQNLLLNEL